MATAASSACTIAAARAVAPTGEPKRPRIQLRQSVRGRRVEGQHVIGQRIGRSRADREADAGRVVRRQRHLGGHYGRVVPLRAEQPGQPVLVAPDPPQQVRAVARAALAQPERGQGAFRQLQRSPRMARSRSSPCTGPPRRVRPLARSRRGRAGTPCNRAGQGASSRTASAAAAAPATSPDPVCRIASMAAASGPARGSVRRPAPIRRAPRGQRRAGDPARSVRRSGRRFIADPVPVANAGPRTARWGPGEPWSPAATLGIELAAQAP